MRRDFNEEHGRAKRIQSTLAPHTEEAPALAPVVSGYAEVLPKADALVTKQIQHEKEGIILSLEEEQLTLEMAEKRVQARIIVQGMTEGGLNSNLLPPMGYKRAVDRDSGLTRKSSEPSPTPPLTNPPPSGEAPV